MNHLFTLTVTLSLVLATTSCNPLSMSPKNESYTSTSLSDEEKLRRATQEVMRTNPFVTDKSEINRIIEPILGDSMMDISLRSSSESDLYVPSSIVERVIEEMSKINPDQYYSAIDYCNSLDDIIMSYNDKLTTAEVKILHNASIISSEVVFFQSHELFKTPTLRADSGWGQKEIEAVNGLVEDVWRNRCARSIIGGAVAGSLGGWAGVLVGAIGGAIAGC